MSYIDGRKTPLENELLAHLPTSELDQVRSTLTPMTFKDGDIIYQRQQFMESVHFLQSGIVALMIDLEDGFQADAGLVGPEGMVGVPLLSGYVRDVAAVVALTDGSALRMSGDAFAKAMENLPTLRTMLLRYAEVLRTQAMQLAACNVHHGLEARLARCLLMLQDRQHSVTLPITQEELAGLLSAHRPSVSVAAKRLREAGLIQYSSGRIVVTDRPGLEGAACECYGLIREHTKRLIAS